MSKELTSLAITYAVCVILWYGLQSYGHYLLFKKAKVNTNLAFIPLLREYKMFELTWKNPTVRLAWVVGMVGFPLFYLGSTFNIQIIAWLGLFMFIAGLVLSALRAFQEAKAYNKGAGIGVAIMFLAPVANIVLGKSDADYQGAI